MHRNTQSRKHRRPGPLIGAGVAGVALLAAACSSTAKSGSSAAVAASSAHAQATATAAAPAQALKPLRQPGARCGTPKTKATLVRFQAPDGTGLDGVLIGRGTTGVVLAHEYASDLCNFWPFAGYLAKHGLRAFAIDMRCFGRSACPAGGAKGRVVDDIAAAIAELRHRGVTKVALVGASMGGSAALIAATRIQPPVDAVVELSGEANPTQLLGIPLNARAAVGQLTVPAMFVVANLDQYTSVEATRALYQAAKTSDKRLEVLSGQFDGLHGTGLLTNVSGGFSSVATTVADFITTHTQS